MGAAHSVIIAATTILPAIITGIAHLFTRTPTEQNPTQQAIDEHHAHKEAERRLREQREEMEREQREREEANRRRFQAEQDRLKQEAEKKAKEMEERMRQLEKQHREEQERLQREAQEREQQEREKVEREQRQRAEEERRRHEEEQNRLKEQAEIDRRALEERMRQLQIQHQQEQERLQREAREREQQEREKVEREQRQRAEEEQRRYEEMQARLREQAEQERKQKEAQLILLQSRHEEEQKRLKLEADAKLAAETARLEEVQHKLLSGIQPEVWPTPEERAHAAKILMQPAKDYFHCAVAGTAGAGKSSLINAFRGLKNSDPSPLTAKTGETETTLEIGCFPHPSSHKFLHRFVWYDIPGAGTVKVKGWQYFNNQGLFVFDLIVVVVGDRFTQQDVIILEHCQRFKIPAFIVRSKANQYIKNRMENSLGYEGSDDERDFEEVYQQARREYEEGTRRNFRNTLREVGLDTDTKIYIVNNNGVYHLLSSTERKLKGANRLIDEEKLAQDLVGAIEARRYGSNE